MNGNNFSNKKLVAEDLERISTEELRGNTFLKENRKARITFESGSEISLSVRNSNMGGFIFVSNSHVRESGNSFIELCKVRCNFGGFRYWFFCPKCQKIKAILYRKNKENEFACIKCLGLTYNSRVKSRKCYIINAKYEKVSRIIKKLKLSVKKKSYLRKTTKNFEKLERLKNIQIGLKTKLMIEFEKGKRVKKRTKQPRTVVETLSF